MSHRSIYKSSHSKLYQSHSNFKLKKRSKNISSNRSQITQSDKKYTGGGLTNRSVRITSNNSNHYSNFRVSVKPFSMKDLSDTRSSSTKHSKIFQSGVKFNTQLIKLSDQEREEIFKGYLPHLWN